MKSILSTYIIDFNIGKLLYTIKISLLIIIQKISLMTMTLNTAIFLIKNVIKY